MTSNEIIELARDARLLGDAFKRIAAVKRFAALIAEAEREDILRMSEAQFFKTQADYDDAIRARGARRKQKRKASSRG